MTRICGVIIVSKQICQKCGARCCKEVLIPVSPFIQWDRQWLKARGIKVKGNALLIPNVCRKLKDNLCTIQDKKPDSCREFKCKLLS